MIVVLPTADDVRRLAELAIDPADLADDGTDYAGRCIEKPWGNERQTNRGQDWALWRLAIRAGGETSLHCHPSKTTLLTVETGEIVFSTLHERRILSAGESVLIERGVFHRSSTERGAVVAELEWPNNKRDLVRLADRYGRAGQGYERVA